MKGKIEKYIKEQAALHSRVVPEDVVVPLSAERARRLDTLGYLNR